ncbi:carboxypeptidase regulatory-like domain-containing protein [Halomontanus rarus]|uniref:carboxypeptidase regulatory-like domain-containing protein n=1 Tax=Halomontanus rarus TaxID=3034020 RepID=UPI001A995E2E
MKVDRQLVLEIDRDDVVVGDTVTVRVRDEWNRPIEGALVRSDAEGTRTDESGQCRLTFREPGFWTLVATKSSTEHVGYERARQLLRVVPETTSPRAAQ